LAENDVIFFKDVFVYEFVLWYWSWKYLTDRHDETKSDSLILFSCSLGIA